MKFNTTTYSLESNPKPCKLTIKQTTSVIFTAASIQLKSAFPTDQTEPSTASMLPRQALNLMQEADEQPELALHMLSTCNVCKLR